MPSFANRLSEQFASFGQLCVGIDPSAEQLGQWSLPDSANGAKRFALEILEASQGQVGIVKPQVAFFEQYGAVGLAALNEVMSRAKEMGFLVIADAKRGDIGSTMAGYARAWLSEEATFEADALTLSPFLGLETLRQTIDTALSNQKGVFILSATSNPEAASIQTAMIGSQSVAASVASFAASFVDTDLGSVGLVLGATVDLESFGLVADGLVNVPVLMPGFGQQGASLTTVSTRYKLFRSGLICNVSRSVAGDSATGLTNRISSAKRELEQGLER
ncbi:unannotated protein [freshwater metagenome]|uniref:Orotidine 5'-phosphate decarboxylase n=1 Tax=freshwater metagenome TaxID=449393 RepID=A0A6J6IC13_9ZZZZ|nr:orotidine-5'-phosphate decarboxylase [Actinomycetota bacterium]